MKIGEVFEDGIIFEIDSLKEHGKIVSRENLSENAKWDKAILLCQQYRGGGKYGWYLPSSWELCTILKNRDKYPIHKSKWHDGVFSQKKDKWGFCSETKYWSSSISDKNAKATGMRDYDYFAGICNPYIWGHDKDTRFCVRAVRKF